MRFQHVKILGVINMSPHPYRGRFNMALCWPCGGKRSSHTASDAETHCNPKKQRPP